MKKTDIAYMAGVFDGEGCISITKVHPQNTNLHNPSYGLQVRVSMVDKSIPLLFQFAFGGSLKSKPPRNEREKLQWGWRIYGMQAIECLKILFPYLKSKRTEAEIAIKFWTVKRHRGSNKGEHGNYPKTETELAIEETQYILMRQLKDKSEVHNG